MDNSTAGHTSTSFPYTDDDIASWLTTLEVPLFIALDSAYVPVVLAAVQRDRHPLAVIHLGTLEVGFVVEGVPITGRIVYYPQNIPPKSRKYLATLQELGAVLRELHALEDWGTGLYFSGSLMDWLHDDQEPQVEQPTTGPGPQPVGTRRLKVINMALI